MRAKERMNLLAASLSPFLDEQLLFVETSLARKDGRVGWLWILFSWSLVFFDMGDVAAI